LNTELSFINRTDNLDVDWEDYTHDPPTPNSPSYRRLAGGFIEIDIYEERPGGFSPYGSRFYEKFLSSLRQRYGNSVVVMKPPSSNEAEYQRITAVNAVTSAFWYLVALFVPLLITCSISRWVLNKLALSRMTKRTIFTLVNTWLVTPIPLPAAFIMEIPLPNMLAFPWTDLPYYRHVASFAEISFFFTFLICAAASISQFRGTVTRPTS
jgi:hypothetical protein